MNYIIGAGFTGMAAGIKTGWPIFEATEHAGGICRSYKKDGFEFSTGGGHWLFGKGVGLDYIKSIIEVKEYERRAGIYYHHTFPYPFQTTANKAVSVDPSKKALKNWLAETFGKEQFNLFFGPFNEKYTAGLYEEVIQELEYKSPPAGGKGFCPTFCDPVGGLDALIEKMSQKCHITYRKAIVAVDLNRNEVHFEDGDRLPFKKLISTIPLNNLLKMCGYSPHTVFSNPPLSKQYTLPYTSVLVINIGAERGLCTPTEHWLYIPFCKSNFYRVGFYSNIDSSKAPGGKVSLSVEMAFYNKKYEDLDIESITYDVIKELQEWNWIGKVVTVDPTWVECAYTWLYNKNDAQKHIDWLKSKGVISIGRYGKWRFQGMIEGIKDGLEVVV